MITLPDMESILRVYNLSKTIAGKQLFENTTFDVYPEDCIGLLGPNGCGKTTLFSILLGKERSNMGDVEKKEGLQIRCLELTQPYWTSSHEPRKQRASTSK